MSKTEDSRNPDRRTFLKGMLGLAATAALSGPQNAEAQEKALTLDTLPKGPEDIYLLLFENNPTDGRTDDDFIADAAQAAGYTAPFQWHVEVMYFDPRSTQWMVMGCRPPKCSIDIPASRILAQHRADTVRVNKLKVSVKQQLRAREFFTRTFEGKPYSLSGPSKTNCSDVPAELAGQLGISGVRTFTKQELAGSSAIKNFLAGHGTTLDGILKRDDLTFPDAFENMGEKMGVLRF